MTTEPTESAEENVLADSSPPASAKAMVGTIPSFQLYKPRSAIRRFAQPQTPHSSFFLPEITPQFVRLDDYDPPTRKTAVVRDGRLTITKKRQERLKLETEAPGFYFLSIDVGQWVHDVPDYIHKVDFFWRRDKRFQTRTDSTSTSVNWRPARDRVLRVIALRHGDELRSPYPPYTEHSIRKLDTNKEG